ncbi:uncharacterized protein LOC112906710 [Agrilus planipennis]|uniref:Uncharacterized protein LOC112906710 n=1 Tax=Agrilus planipennis TaxID=224129 RepID=A0A7F5RMY2_AGRPL|nr:uncharacterized protein LOC112906710 [Agrilus planipennis]
MQWKKRLKGAINDARNEITKIISASLEKDKEQYYVRRNISENDFRELNDLKCAICNKFDVEAVNRLIECNVCQALYHRECYTPRIVWSELNDDKWTCRKCELKENFSSVLSTTSSVTGRTRTPLEDATIFSRSDNNSQISEKKNVCVGTRVASTKTKATKRMTAAETVVSRVPFTRSCVKKSIVSKNTITRAEKRIINMKKKAVKLQEQRKMP